MKLHLIQLVILEFADYNSLVPANTLDTNSSKNWRGSYLKINNIDKLSEAGSKLQEDKIAQRQICTKGQFCTSDKFARRVKFARLSNLHGGSRGNLSSCKNVFVQIWPFVQFCPLVQFCLRAILTRPRLHSETIILVIILFAD